MGDVTAAWSHQLPCAAEGQGNWKPPWPPLPLVRLSSCLGARLWGLWAPLLWPFVNGMKIHGTLALHQAPFQQQRQNRARAVRGHPCLTASYIPGYIPGQSNHWQNTPAPRGHSKRHPASPDSTLSAALSCECEAAELFRAEGPRDASSHTSTTLPFPARC